MSKFKVGDLVKIKGLFIARRVIGVRKIKNSYKYKLEQATHLPMLDEDMLVSVDRRPSKLRKDLRKNLLGD